MAGFGSTSLLDGQWSYRRHGVVLCAAMLATAFACGQTPAVIGSVTGPAIDSQANGDSSADNDDLPGDTSSVRAETLVAGDDAPPCADAADVLPDMAPANDSAGDAADVAEGPKELPNGPTDVATSYLQGPPTSNCPTFAQLWQTSQPAGFVALAPAVDGGFALAGHIGGVAWVVRVNAKGEPLWHKVIGQGAVRDIAAMPDGGWAVVGGPSEGGFTARLDDAGNALWLKPWLALGGPRKVLALPNGTLAVALWLAEGGGYGAVGLARLDAAGEQLSLTVNPDGKNAAIYGLSQLSSSAIAMTVTVKAGAGTSSSYLWKLDSAGQALAEEPICGTGRLGVVADGGLLLGCNTNAYTSGLLASYVQRRDGLAVTWSTYVTSFGPSFFAWWSTTAFAAFAKGDAVIASSEKSSRWSRVDADGQFAWQRSALATAALYPHGDGGFAGVGSTPEPTAAPVFFRADRWGYIACAQSTACASLASAACNDGNGCTSDVCVAPADCTHTALEDGVPCGVDPAPSFWQFTMFCKSGVCAAK